jgi:cytochrome P450
MTESQRHPPRLDASGADLRATNAALRSQGPATLVELPGEVPAWSVTRYSVIKKLTEDPRVSRDASQHWPALPGMSEDWPLAPFVAPGVLLNTYGDAHRQLRAAAEVAFTPERIDAQRALLHGFVDGLLSDLLLSDFSNATSGRSIDLHRHFSHPVSATALCNLIGVPDQLRPRALRGIAAMVGSAADANPDRVSADLADLLACVGELIDVKSARPGADLTSDLIAANQGPAKLGPQQIAGNLFLMIGAGVAQTANLITNAVESLLTHPDQRFLVETGAVAWDDVIAETLRTEGPAQHTPLRYAIEDIDLGDGTVIKAGDAIILGFGGTGTDPDLYGDNAEKFDISRAANESLAFGHGVHHCLGAPLARMEAGVALPALFASFPSLALAVHPDELRHQTSFIHNGYQELPVFLHETAA